MIKKTALYGEHLRCGGKMVEFAGWSMPVQYTGLADEHEACRSKAGLFDVSHMGEIRIRGAGALGYLNKLVTNDVAKIKDNQAQYSVLCYDHGGCVDDLIIHRLSDDDFFICVNASNCDKDFAWMKEHAPRSLSVENVSAEYSQIAVQGRFAQEILQRLTGAPLSDIKYYWFLQSEVLGKRAIIARTGYTGEDGFEIYAPWDFGPEAWNALLDEGKKHGLKPCGLGARDTLRTEMKYALYGHEIDERKNPLEAGLGWVVKLTKVDFIGKAALSRLKENGIKRASVGLKSLGRAIPRQGYFIESNGQVVGEVTSGTMSPSLKTGIAIAAVDRAFADVGNKLDVVIRDQRIPHEIVETPFYKRPY